MINLAVLLARTLGDQAKVTKLITAVTVNITQDLQNRCAMASFTLHYKPIPRLFLDIFYFYAIEDEKNLW